MKPALKMKSLKEENLSRKFLLIFILMALVPILLTMYLIYMIIIPGEESMGMVRMGIFWMVSAALAGFWVAKRIMHSILSLAENTKAVANGDFSKRVATEDKDEISELAKTFNRITQKLEENIADLKASKQTLQDVLSKIGTAISSFQNIDTFLELIVQTMASALGAKTGTLMLIDSEGKELFIKAAFGLDKAEWDKAGVKFGEGVVGSVAKKGKPLLASGPSQGESGNSLVCVPLIYSKKVIGTISLTDKREGDFTDDDLVLLSNLATQTAVAVENARLNENVEQTYLETISALAMAVEARDSYSRGHSARVAEYATKIARAFSMDEEIIKTLGDAANLHDIGKIGLSDAILHKPSILTGQEIEVVKEHPVIGESIMRPIHSLRPLCDLVRHHHEWLDGKGYPDGLKGKELSKPVRIMVVADAFDAMTSDRPYRKAMSSKAAKAELARCIGTRYDAEVVKVAQDVL